MSPEDVGLNAAIISAAVLLSFFSRFGLDEGLIRYLPGYDGDLSALINSVFVVTVVSSLFASVVFLLGIPIWSPSMEVIQSQPILLVIFVVSVVGVSTSGLVERIFVASRKAAYVLYFGVFLGLGRLATLAIVVIVATPLGIFTAWGLPAMVASILALIVVLPALRRGYRPGVAFKLSPIKIIGPFSASAFGSAVWVQFTVSVLPILILNMMGSQHSAFFFASWTIGSRLFTIPTSISMSLFAEGSNDEGQLIPSIKRSLRLSAALLIPAVTFLVIAAKPILQLMGDTYMEEAHQLLWVISISALPFAVNAIYVGVMRVEKNKFAVVAVPGVVCLITLPLSYMLIPHLGILGAGIGFLTAQTLTAAVLLPSLMLRIAMQPNRQPVS